MTHCNPSHPVMQPGIYHLTTPNRPNRRFGTMALGGVWEAYGKRFTTMSGAYPSR